MSSQDVSTHSDRPEWTEERLQDEVAIVGGHVEALTQRLREHVREQLEAECTGAAKEWIDRAFHALLSELPGEETQDLSNLEHARNQATSSLQRALSKESRAPEPSAEEVLEHTRELAQCLVSNWVTDVKLAARRHKGAPVELDADWQVVGSSRSVTEGVSLFAADPSFVRQQWNQYLTEKTASGRPFVVASGVQIVQENGLFQVVPRVWSKLAEAAVEQAVAAVMPPPPSGPSETINVSNALEHETDVMMARVVAAAITASDSTAVRKPSRWKVDQSLYADVVKAVGEGCVAVLEQIQPGASVAQSLEKHIEQQWRAIEGRLEQQGTELEPEAGQHSWTRILRIAAGATVLTNAVTIGAVDLQIEHERYRLHEHSSHRLGRVKVPGERVLGKVMGIAESVARGVVGGTGGHRLKVQLQNWVHRVESEDPRTHAH